MTLLHLLEKKALTSEASLAAAIMTTGHITTGLMSVLLSYCSFTHIDPLSLSLTLSSQGKKGPYDPAGVGYLLSLSISLSLSAPRHPPPILNPNPKHLLNCAVSMIERLLRACITRVEGHWGFPKIRGTLLGGPNDKEYSPEYSMSILGSPYLGKLPLLI